jgi:hypothetical protein
MRRLVLIASALLVLPALAFAGAVVTDGTDTLRIKAKFDPAKASKRKGAARPVEFKPDYFAGTTDGSRLADVRSVSVFAGGAVTAYDAFPKCAERKLVEEGPRACPKGSKVGSGTATAEIHDPNTTTSTALVPAKVTIYNGKAQTDRDGDPLATPKDSILFYAVAGDSRLTLPFWAEDGNTRVTYYNPKKDPSPPGDNALYTVKDVHVTFRARSVRKNGRRIPWMAAPRKCDGSWIVTATSDRYEGGELTAKHAVKCKKA